MVFGISKKCLFRKYRKRRKERKLLEISEFFDVVVLLIRGASRSVGVVACLLSLSGLLGSDFAFALGGELCLTSLFGSQSALGFLLLGLLFGELLRHIHWLEEDDGDKDLGDDEEDEAESNGLHLDPQLCHCVNSVDAIEVVERKLAVEEQPESEEQNDDRDDEEAPRHRGANLQDEEFQQLADAFEHQQGAEQLRDILHNLVGVPEQDETKEACVCDAKDKTNGVMHGGRIINN